MTNAHPRADRFVGGVLGLALGDAVGAPHEGAMGHATHWQNLSLTSPGFGHYTDDTEMALGVLRSHAACGGFDADHLAKTWADRADPGRGYGGGALRVLGMIREGVPWREANRRVFPDGSFGNGGAMRATPIGLLHADDPESLDAAARKAAEVTHAHPLGIDGSVLIARAAAAAFRDASAAAVLTSINAGDLAPEFRTRIDAAREMANAPPPEPREVADRLGNRILAHESAVTAVYLAQRFADDSFDHLMRCVIAVGGDVDTIGAMGGGVWGSARGAAALPKELLQWLEDREEIERLARTFHRGDHRDRGDARE